QQHCRGLAKRGMKLRVIVEGGRAEIALTDGRPRQPDVVDDMRCRVREIGDDMAHLDMTEGVALPYIDGAARTVEQVIQRRFRHNGAGEGASAVNAVMRVEKVQRR